VVSRSFQLPADVDQSRAQAVYKDGVLDLTLPKKTVSKSQQVPVQ
jgi:HSP20 family protein